MTRLYKKSELGFALLWIGLYVVLSSAADQLSEGLGTLKCVTAPLHAAMCLVLLLWIRKSGLMEKYGLCASRVPARKLLYYLPLAIVASAQLWGGAAARFSPAGTALYVVSMLLVGVLEEVIFRGFLFRALEKDSRKTAIIVSSLTFGLGHFVNLINGSGQSAVDTGVQMVFAVAVGFALVYVLLRGGSLIPCVVFHSINNALGAFSVDMANHALEIAGTLLVTVVVLGGYIAYLAKTTPKEVR